MAMIKSNDRMPARTRCNIDHVIASIDTLPKSYRPHAHAFAERVTPLGLFEILHSMRRWYSGQTMARKLLAHRAELAEVMDLDPDDVVGVYRGFKVPNDNPLASVVLGAVIRLPVKLNHSFSSWSTTEAPTHRFSGGGRGKTGLVVQLVDGRGTRPVLAPPNRTRPWFNALYAAAIGTSYRPTEGEYLIAAPTVRVKIVRVKR